MPGDLPGRRALNLKNPLRRDSAASPIGDYLGADADQIGQLGEAASHFDGTVDRFHAPILNTPLNPMSTARVSLEGYTFCVMPKKSTEQVSAQPLIDWFSKNPKHRKQFTKAAGYSSAVITNWVKGRKTIPRAEVSKVATYMGIDERRYRELAGTPLPSPRSDDGSGSPSLTKEAEQIARAWQKLPPARQQAFRDSIFLEAIVSQQYPWLIRGRPPGESYDDFERRMERDIVRVTKRLMMREDEQ